MKLSIILGCILSLIVGAAITIIIWRSVSLPSYMIYVIAVSVYAAMIACTRGITEVQVNMRERTAAIEFAEATKYQTLHDIPCYKCGTGNDCLFLLNAANSFTCTKCESLNKVIFAVKSIVPSNLSTTIDMEDEILKGTTNG